MGGRGLGSRGSMRELTIGFHNMKDCYRPEKQHFAVELVCKPVSLISSV
jgi:hypothetical protein